VKEFHPNEQNNPVEMDGEATFIQRNRTAIKLSEGPKILICVPIGGKAYNNVLPCPECVDAKGNPIKYEVSHGHATGGLVPMQFMLSTQNWLPPLNVTLSWAYKTGVLSAQARQIMTQEAKRIPTVEYIFYVDDDTLIPPMGLYTLYNFMETHPEAGAVSGIYTTRQKPAEPLIYTDHGKGAAWDIEMGEGANPTPIMGAGAGCLLARVDAIKDWEAANPGEPIWCDSMESPASNGGRVMWGHDVRFVRNLVEAGWPCYADGRVLCGHFDIPSGQIFEVPANAPGFKKRAVNTETYWDAVYSSEGMNSWRTYEDMFGRIEDVVRMYRPKSVLELGCGSGVLGQRLTAKFPLRWFGLDMSKVAVAQARARYLRAEQFDVRDMQLDAYKVSDKQMLIATELLEHLTWDEGKDLLEKMNQWDFKQLVFATPFETMHPDEVPEHEVFVDAEYREAVKGVLTNFTLEDFDVVDEQGHAVWVFARK
jgi:SAM-dependent methyltransferase